MKFRKLKIFPNVILTANKYNYSSKNGFIPKIFFIIAKINHFAYFEKKRLIFFNSRLKMPSLMKTLNGILSTWNPRI